MKVRVSYSVTLEQVPGIVERLLSECRQKLYSQYNNLDGGLYDVPVLLEKLAHAREDLALADSQMEDMAGMLAGWHDARQEKYISEPFAAKEKAEEEVIADDTD